MCDKVSFIYTLKNKIYNACYMFNKEFFVMIEKNLKLIVNIRPSEK